MKTFFILLCLFPSLILYSQEKDDSIFRNAVFYEIAGSGGSSSLNYERTFGLNSWIDLSARAGFGMSNLTDFEGNFNPNVVVPIMAGIMFGKTHHAEFNVGVAYSSIVEADIQTGSPTRKGDLSTIFNLGYRYQKPGGRLLLRAGYTPIVEFNEIYEHWAGVSIGFLF